MQSDRVSILFHGFFTLFMVLELLSTILDNHVQSYQL